MGPMNPTDQLLTELVRATEKVADILERQNELLISVAQAVSGGKASAPPQTSEPVQAPKVPESVQKALAKARR